MDGEYPTLDFTLILLKTRSYRFLTLQDEEGAAFLVDQAVLEGAAVGVALDEIGGGRGYVGRCAVDVIV